MLSMTRVEKKELRKKIVIGILLILLIVIVLLQIVKRMDFFNIKYIDIKGNQHVEEEDLLKNTGIRKGKNSFDIFLFKEKSNIINNPYVNDVKLKRTLPNRILIKIDEKDEVFKIKNLKKLIILDKNGIILDIRNKANDKITIINGLKLSDKISEKDLGKSIYDYIESDELIDFFKLNSEIGLLETFKEIDILEGNKIKIITYDDEVIEFGRLRDEEYKFKMLNEILNHIESEDIGYEKILMDKGDDPIIVRKKGSE